MEALSAFARQNQAAGPGTADFSPFTPVGAFAGLLFFFPEEPGPAPSTPRGTHMLDEIRERIGDEIENLSRELNVELPERIAAAVELGDLRENSEYRSALDRQQFVQARLEHLSQRLSELSKIDVKSMPEDRVGFGSKVKILDLELDEETTLTLVAGDFMDLDGGQVSLASPIGAGLMGARADEEVTIQLPRGERRYLVKEVLTLPQQLGLVESE
jgi:transcription elongation factor GreA